jgi:hypothetical protein
MTEYPGIRLERGARGIMRQVLDRRLERRRMDTTPHPGNVVSIPCLIRLESEADGYL